MTLWALQVLFAALALTGIQAPLPVTLADAALLDAAQRNDLPAVTRALDQGANVDAEARYRRTALLFAARNANLDMVKVLLERGADVTVRDTFYGRTALTNAIRNDSVPMALYLVEQGAPAGADALAYAIETADPPLLRAVLARGAISDAMLAATLRLHGDAADTEVAVILAEAIEGRPGVGNSLLTLPEGALESFTGTYRQDSNAYFPDSAAHTVVFALEDAELTATLGQRKVRLFATSELTFIAPGMPEADFRFERDGDVVERSFVIRPVRAREDTTSPYIRVSEVTTVEIPSGNVTAADVAPGPRETPRPWPSFRGPGASGIGDGQGAVAEWDLPTGRNIRWKTPIPGIANASPIVWGDRVFVVTAISGAGDTTFRIGDYGNSASVNDMSEHTFKLYALDGNDGRIVWEREVHQGVPRTTRHPKGSHASSTPVTDGRHVVALFGTAGLLVAYGMDGELLWEKDLGVLDSGHFYAPAVQWGHSSSPIIYLDSVILQVDRQTESFVAAYDIRTGTERWRTSRDDEIPTWGTPTIATGQAGDELVTNGTKIRGYDPETGKLRWTLAPNSEVTVATPVVGPDFVYVTGGYAPTRPIYAIRPGASGDISLERGTRSNRAIAWSSDREGTYIPTPIVYRGLLYMLNNNGIITVYNAATGERAYRARVGSGGSFAASLVAADGRLYVASEDGDVFVIKAGREYVEIARNEMNEVIMATPAISDGLIIVRTLGHVYGIGESP